MDFYLRQNCLATSSYVNCQGTVTNHNWGHGTHECHEARASDAPPSSKSGIPRFQETTFLYLGDIESERVRSWTKRTSGSTISRLLPSADLFDVTYLTRAALRRHVPFWLAATCATSVLIPDTIFLCQSETKVEFGVIPRLTSFQSPARPLDCPSFG